MGTGTSNMKRPGAPHTLPPNLRQSSSRPSPAVPSHQEQVTAPPSVHGTGPVQPQQLEEPVQQPTVPPQPVQPPQPAEPRRIQTEAVPDPESFVAQATLKLSNAGWDTNSGEREIKSSENFVDVERQAALDRAAVALVDPERLRDVYGPNFVVVQDLLLRHAKLALLLTADVCHAHACVLINDEIVVESSSNGIIDLAPFKNWSTSRLFLRVEIPAGYNGTIPALRCSLQDFCALIVRANGSPPQERCPCQARAYALLRALRADEGVFCDLPQLFTHLNLFSNADGRGRPFEVQIPPSQSTDDSGRPLFSGKYADNHAKLDNIFSRFTHDWKGSQRDLNHFKFLDRLFWLKQHTNEMRAFRIGTPTDLSEDSKLRCIWMDGRLACPFNDPLDTSTMSVPIDKTTKPSNSTVSNTTSLIGLSVRPETQRMRRQYGQRASAAVSDNVPAYIEGVEIEEEPIAAGNFGAVYRGKWRLSRVACKQLVKGEARHEELLREACTIMELSKESHKNIMQLHGLFKQDGSVFIVMELCAGGSLKALFTGAALHDIIPQGDVPALLRHAAKWGRQIAAGMHHVVLAGFVHRDLRADNILMTEGHASCKIADVGLSRPATVDEPFIWNPKDEQTPAPWYPPEALEGFSFHLEKSDMYCYGVVLWEILSLGAFPWLFEFQNYGKKDERWPYFAKRQVLSGQMLAKPSNIPDDWYDLLQGCWAKDFNDRPSFSAVHANLKALSSRRHSSEFSLNGSGNTDSNNISDGELLQRHNEAESGLYVDT